MTEYAHIKDGAVWRQITLDAPPPAHKAGFLLPIEEDRPTYDPVSEYLTGPVETIEANRVLRQWTKHARPTAEMRSMVKEEAGRRIRAIYPDWRQANMTARAAELARIQQGLMRDVDCNLIAARTLTAEEVAEEQVINAAWVWIKAVRAASDTIEALDPIPADYDADARWPDAPSQ